MISRGTVATITCGRRGVWIDINFWTESPRIGPLCFLFHQALAIQWLHRSNLSDW